MYHDNSLAYRFVFLCLFSKTLAHDKQLTWGQAVEQGKQLFYKNPLCFSLWYPDGSIKSNYWQHLFSVIFFHYLPAYFIDGLLVLMRRKPLYATIQLRFFFFNTKIHKINQLLFFSLVNIQKRISQGLKVLQYYTTKNWTFKNEKFLRMKENMSEKDQNMFYFSVEEVR